MKQTIEIEIPEGKKAIWKDNRVILEDIKPLPKTWNEFCKLYHIKKGEAFITDCSNIEEYKNDILGDRTFNDCNVLPSIESAEQHLTLMQLHQLRDCYRQGWIPDWANNDDYKYCIFKVGSSLKIDAFHCMPYFLSFPTKELAQQFLDNFKDLIEQAGDLI